jgi:hypothetical protein
MAGTAAVVLLVGCGGGDSSTGSSATSSAAESTTAAGADDFCTQAAGIDTRVDSALADLGPGDPSLPDAFRQIAAELRGIDPPDEIAADWDALAGGLDRIGDAVADIDITDPDSLAALDDIEGDLSTASSNVQKYLREECGIDTSDPAAPTS